MQSKAKRQAKELDLEKLERGAGWQAHRNWKKEIRFRAEQGKIIIKAKEQSFEVGPQGYHRFVLAPWMKDIAHNFMFFHSQLIPHHSGRHTHQGGIGIFILEGKGYSVVDGVRYDWKEGDMIMLPIKKGGCEHQHFNLDPSKPAKWLRVGPLHTFELMGGYSYQKELAPAWKEKYGDHYVNP